MTKLKLSKKSEKELKDIKKDLGLDELEKLDKECRHKECQLHCVNCGVLINDKFTGGIYSYIHQCHLSRDNMKTFSLDFPKEKTNHCTFLTTLKDGKHNGCMMSSSLYGDLSTKKCKECKTDKEHIERTIQSYLGKNYRDYTPENKIIEKEKKEFIEAINQRVKEDPFRPPEDFINFKEETNKAIKEFRGNKDE